MASETNRKQQRRYQNGISIRAFTKGQSWGRVGLSRVLPDEPRATHELTVEDRLLAENVHLPCHCFNIGNRRLQARGM